MQTDKDAGKTQGDMGGNRQKYTQTVTETYIQIQPQTRKDTDS